MMQMAEHLRLELEPPRPGGRLDAPAHELQGDGAVGAVLDREVDGAHAAGGEHPGQVIAPDHARCRGGRLGRDALGLV